MYDTYCRNTPDTHVKINNAHYCRFILPKPFPTTHIKILYGTLYVIDKTDVIDRNANLNATESRNQNTFAEVEILTKNDWISNQETSAQQVHGVEDDTKFDVAEEENNESANKDKDTLEKVSHVPHFIEEKQTHSLLPNLDTKGDQLCFSCVFRLISRKN